MVCAGMKDERNCLLRDALPQLQQFAVVNELQLQVVDLRWGASSTMVTDPDCQPVYLEQIDYCRQYSAGPFFAVGNFVTSALASPTSTNVIVIVVIIIIIIISSSSIVLSIFIYT